MTLSLSRRRLLWLASGPAALWGLAGALRAEGQAEAPLAAPAAPPTDSPALPFAARTPLHPSAAALAVRDLAMMTRFYRSLLGFDLLDQTGEQVLLGAGGRPLLQLIARPEGQPAPRGSAGLYHLAWLMPERADLARWLVQMVQRDVPLTGFADHLVSEAVYLDDPEGNGIEVYADRPAESWDWRAGRVEMATDPLDIRGLLALTQTDRRLYGRAPAGLVLGHVHLKVGDVAQGQALYRDGLGLDLTRERPGSAAFLSSGGYHHHLAINSWESQGAGARAPGGLGLEWVALQLQAAPGQGARDRLADLAARLRASGQSLDQGPDRLSLRDAWGTGLRIEA